MSSRIRVFATSVGTKLLIGVTGLALFLYLITHIAGNALIFLGPTTFNQYANTLTSNPLIPVIEVGLLLIFLVHVYKTVTMYLGNQQARPVSYVVKRSQGRPSRKSFASSTMIFTGLWLLIFIVIHVKAFKYGTEYETANGIRDLYRTEMEVFRGHLSALFYVASMLVVGLHLWHGSSSTFQSLGLDHPRWTPRILTVTKVLAAVIAGGFVIIVAWAHLTQLLGQVGQ
jgi:succinate dehydrogenase / fumarate reductase cytochrome b subunit